MPDPQYEYRKQRYESYVKERENLNHSSLEISGRYDKSVLFLSGGALALSVTFIEKIAPSPVAWTFVLLAAAWLFLISCVVLELYALATSQTAINEQIRLLDAEYDEFLQAASDTTKAVGVQTGPPAAAESKFTVRTRRLNVWSLRSLVFGLACLCFFSGVNLPFHHKEESMAEKTANSKGSYVPPGNVRPPPPPPTPPPAPSQQPQK
jgi:hypothetical protein